MKHLSNFLLPESVNLSLKANEEGSALQAVLQCLEDDPRLSSWKEFLSSITAKPLYPLKTNHQPTIMIAHSRAACVKDLLMAVGRNIDGINFHDVQEPIPLLFVIGIPHELNNEYLRIMGSIARACSNPKTLEKLLSTENSHEFVMTLSQECEMI